MSLQRASYIVAAFLLLGFSFHCGFAAQSDFVRFSKPELLTFDQLVDLEKNDPSSSALAEKLEHLLTTPFLSNEAYFNDAKPKRPSRRSSALSSGDLLENRMRNSVRSHSDRALRARKV